MEAGFGTSVARIIAVEYNIMIDHKSIDNRKNSIQPTHSSAHDKLNNNNNKQTNQPTYLPPMSNQLASN